MLVEAGLEVLADLGWVKLVEVKTTGRPSEIVKIHPELIRG